MMLGLANQYSEANIQQFLPEILFDQRFSFSSEEICPAKRCGQDSNVSVSVVESDLGQLDIDKCSK